MVGKNKEDYLFAKTGMTIEDSILLPKTSYENIDSYIQQARQKDGYKSITNLRNASIEITDHHIRLIGQEPYEIHVPTVYAMLKREVEERIQDTLFPSFEKNLPHLRMDTFSYQEVLTQIKKGIGTSKKHMDPTGFFRLEDERLVWYFWQRGQLCRLETKVKYSANDIQFPCPIDTLWLSRMLMRMTYIQDFVILPRKDYCLIEGYNGELITKVRMKIST